MASPTLRLYLRRSKADEGHQAFSLDTQREGCRRFVGDLSHRGIVVRWEDRIEHVDDDRAGDDFLGRAGLQRLLTEVQRGDVIVCRDQSRLGREAIEVTLVVRELVQRKGARLLYYVNGQEVPFTNALDGTLTYIQGVGHQMELEAIRSRTREALRARVRAGRIAGGRCFGYSLERRSEGAGREYTVAVVDEKQAEIVRRIFAEFVGGRGLKRIAIGLNDDGIPSPHAGVRGTGSWAPSCVRAMLRNERYRGVYVHGRVQRVRRGGRRVKVDGAPGEIITVEIPEWRIVDDIAWQRAQATFRTNEKTPAPHAPNARHMLSGVARCGTCGGTIGVTRTKRSGGERVAAYVCQYHRERGPKVCPVTLHQEIDEVDEALVGYMEGLLTPARMGSLLRAIRDEVERQFATETTDTDDAEDELERLRGEQRNLAQAIAAGGGAIPEVVAELQRRHERIKQLESRRAPLKPTARRAAVAELEGAALRELASIRKALRASPADAREALRALFPAGLVLTPAPEKTGARRVWRVQGRASFDGFRLACDPTGT